MCWWWRRSRCRAASRPDCVLRAQRLRRPSWPRRRWPTRSRRWPGVMPAAASWPSRAAPDHGSRRALRCSPSTGVLLTRGWPRHGTSAAGPGIQIGMDTPQVTAELLDDCLQRLTAPSATAALGLAEDGGWWVLGLRQPDPRVFLGVPMSTPRTGLAQLRRFATWATTRSDCPACATSITWTTRWRWRTTRPVPVSPMRAVGCWRRSDPRTRHRRRRLHRVGPGRSSGLARPPSARAGQPLTERSHGHAGVPEPRSGVRLGRRG